MKTAIKTVIAGALAILLLIFTVDIISPQSTVGGISHFAFGDNHWRTPVAQIADLPITNNRPGDTIRVLATWNIYYWNGVGWVLDSSSQGSGGTDGTNGTDGKTVRNGSGVPSISLGVDGDFYIDISTWDIYGPRAAGLWGSGTSLVGPQGVQGAAGATGATGATGGQGMQGNTGATGSTGAQGIQGATGNTGATGAIGPAGPSPSGAANLVLATPDGSSGVAALRSIVSTDLPSPLIVPTIQGSSSSGGNFNIKTTSNATKGQIVVDSFWGIGYDSGDGITATNGSTGLEFFVAQGFGAAQTRGGAFAAKLFDSAGKGQLLLTSNGHICLTAGADTNQTPDTCLTRSSAGIWSADTTTDGDGSGTVRATKFRYVCGALSLTCNSSAKGTDYCSSDGSRCHCNGSVWTATPLTGVCD